MKRFEMRVDPLTQEIYYAVPSRGYALMNDPLLNKGSAYPRDERTEFRLNGLMGELVGTLEEQVERNYGIYKMKNTDMERYVTLIGLLDRNETAFYALLHAHLKEMLPIIYTPTVGAACLQMSHILRRYRGIYISPSNVNYTERLLENVGLPNLSLIVVTDGERILGLGDLGVDGMAIPIGKIALYVAAAGVHPASVLPVCLDVGTDNERLLADPLYVGTHQKRLRGDAYYALVERFVQGVRRFAPRALLQWEDFGKENAFTLLDQYKHRLLSFNDDIQGTGATAASVVKTAMKIKKSSIADERIAIVGFGQAGSGVANALVTMIALESGMTNEEARSHIFPIDIPGLLMDDMPLTPYQKPYAKCTEQLNGWKCGKEIAPSFKDVIANAGITMLIGLSAQKGLFTPEIIKSLSANTERPVILALSNPTSCSEVDPVMALEASGYRALIATGSPFEPVTAPDGRQIPIAQCNNLYIFPGMGLGAIVCQAGRITHRMFHAASCAVSNMITDEQLEQGVLLPSLDDIRKVSLEVAMAVAKEARDSGLGMIQSDGQLREKIISAMWIPRYYPYRYTGSGTVQQ